MASASCQPCGREPPWTWTLQPQSSLPVTAVLADILTSALRATLGQNHSAKLLPGPRPSDTV